jgi:uncharacterized paraquat-inducible protein A
VPITITCPFCDHTRQVPNGYPNRQAKCPKCGTFVPVPQQEEDEEMKRRRAPRWMIAVLIGVSVLALLVLGTLVLRSLRGGD